MKEYKAEEAVVAFIDILGSSEEMQKDPQNALNTVHNAYDAALEMYETIFKEHLDKVQIKIFSDNIVLSCPYEKIGLEKAFHIVVVLSALIQERLLHYYMLSRGGIAVGDFFSDEVMIWGNALVQAHNLECSVAIFPRIVIHPELIAKVGYFVKKETGENEGFMDWIAQDQDGLCYIDYFNWKYMKDPRVMLTVFLEDNDDRLAEHLKNLKVVQKIIWHANYLEKKMEELSDLDDATT